MPARSATPQLVYEKPCPCPPEKVHSEICCGEQMERVTGK